MQLTREAIQRMVGTGGMVMGGGGGGEGGGISVDFLTQNYVAIPYFSQLFTIHGKQTTTVDGTVTDEQDITLPPNTMPSRTETTEGGVTTVVETTITRIEALFDFNSVGGVSALGYNPGGGGGGGADLNALLDSINSSSIGDIAPTASEVGKCLVYNGNNQWTWATPGGGGGLTYGLSWSYGSVSGAQGGSYDGSASKSFVIPNDTSHLSNGAGFITSAALSGYLPLSGGTMTGSIIMKGVNIYMDPADSSSNATPDIVFRYGSGQEKARIWMDDTFSTVVGPQFRIYNTAGTQIVSTRLALASQISDMATKTWVTNQGFLTSETYLGTVTSVKMTVPAGFSISGSPITSSGTLALGFANGYSLPTTAKQSNWDTAYTRITTGTWWGQSMNSSGVVDGTISVKSSGAGTIDLYQPSVTSGNQLTIRQGTAYAEIWNRASTPILVPSGIFGIGIGSPSSITNSSYKLQVAGTAMIGTGYTDTTSGLVIGGAMLKWDNQSKSLYVVQSDGSTAANFYATGGVSALGISTGGTPSVSALTVGTLTASSQLNVGGTSSFTGAMTVNAMTVNGNISATNWQIPTTGYARFARLYLDSTRYVYVSNSHLYFYNGSSSVQIV